MTLLRLGMACLIFCVFASTARATDKYIYHFGGAGDASNGKNVFTDEFVELDRIAKKNQWLIANLFDGDQPVEKQRVAKAIHDPDLQAFRGGSFRNALDEINLKKFKSDDQVLFVINTHGEIDTTINGHNIACSNNVSCDSGDLKDTIQKLESRGVKVAVIDLSCYSGQSLKLADAKTCVISSGTSDDVGFSDFTDNLIAELRPGRSLENIFLDVRKKSQGRGQISTSAGTATTQMIEAMGAESPFEWLPRKNDSCQKTQFQKTIQQWKDILLDQTAVNDYVKATVDYQHILITKKMIDRPLEKAALRTQVAEKKLYDQIYHSLKSKEENPCANFIL